MLTWAVVCILLAMWLGPGAGVLIFVLGAAGAFTLDAILDR